MRLKLNAIRVMAAVLATATALVGGAVLAPFRADGSGAAGEVMPVTDNSAYRVSDEDMLLAYDDGVDREPGKVFNLEVLDALAQGLGFTNVQDAITAIKNEPVPENRGDGNGKGGIRTSADFRKAVGEKDSVRANKNVAVKVGGMVWNAVSLTKDKENNVILTLWESAEDELPESHFAPFGSTQNLKDSEYPSNMYGTSVLRVRALNAGGQYAINDSELSSTLQQNPQSPYAIFTMNDVDCSITHYIVKPSQVAYQETESTVDTWIFGSIESNENKNITNNFPNSAYGKETRGSWNDSGNWGTEYAAKDGYDVWKDDMLWLPSLVETGNDRSGASAGLWETDPYLRSAPIGSDAWTRSGHDTNLTKVYALKYAGGSTAPNVNSHLDESNTTKMCVRPAFHLNLTEAAKYAYMPKPTEDELTKKEIYDGTEKTFPIPYHKELTYTPVKEDPASWWNEDAHTITATATGEYQVTVAPPQQSCWADGTTDPVTYTLIISKADIEQHWGEGDKVSQRQSAIYHDGSKRPLTLPSPSDPSFPLSLVDEKNNIEVTYKNATVSPDSFESMLAGLNGALQTANTSREEPDLTNVGVEFSKDWGAATEVSDPGVYIVVFKAVDTDGNHYDLYGYFTMRIFSEKLTINLDAEDLRMTAEYGDMVHTQNDLIAQIFPHITSITVSAESGDLQEYENGKSKFEEAAKNNRFKFYFRDYPSRGIGTRYDVGEGVMLNVGTYYLFAEYAEEPDGENSGNQTLITFDWQNSSGKSMLPSFTVAAREIDIELALSSHVYGDAPASDWVIVGTPKRSRGKEGNWYGETSAPGDFAAFLDLSYSIDGAYLKPEKTMPAGEYPVIAECGNKNYYVNFSYTNDKKTYTVEKAELLIDRVNPASGSYNGAEHGNVDVILIGLKNNDRQLTKDTDYTLVFAAQSGSLGANDLPQDVGTYTVTVTLSDTDLANNYVMNGAAGSYTITANSVTKPSIGENKTFTYNGQKQTVAVSGFEADKMNSVFSNGAAFEFENGEWRFGATNAGVYTLTVTLKEGLGYEWGGGSVEFTITIQRAKLTVKLGGDSDVFDGNEKDVTVILEGLPPQGAALTEGTDYVVRFDVSDEGELGANGKPQGVGTYTVTVTLSEESEAAGNYELVGAAATFVIANASDAGPVFVYLFVQVAVLIAAAIVLTRKKT